MRALLVLLCLCAGAAVADGLPAHYDVTDVAEDDTLNIRAAPDANAQIIGELRPYTINIEVLMLSPDGKWGMVGNGEGNGWANMRYLAPSNHVSAGEVPRPITCGGTEPFWTLTMGVRGDEYNMMGDDRRDLTATEETVTEDGFTARFLEKSDTERTLIVQRQECSDGMSDRRYGWSATLSTANVPDGTPLSGCCTLDAR